MSREPQYHVPVAQKEMFDGLVGEVVTLFEPYTEAHPVAIALQFLVGFGNAVGHGPHFYVAETKHHTNEFLAVVGTSSRSRKGDAKNIAFRPLLEADPEWEHCIVSGLSSAEGLVYHVRDTNDAEGSLLTDDKRLLVVETEFSSPLKQFMRQGNTLSALLRDVWDSKPQLQNLTKNSPQRATNAHISIIAHTTPEDLVAHLHSVDIANGLGNRFLFALTRRAKLLPSPSRAPRDQVKLLAQRVRAALDAAKQVGVMHRSKKAETLWEQQYPHLTEEEGGVIGQLLARSEAHVLRLSALYALLEHSSVIKTHHIKSALAVWRYCEASARILFVDAEDQVTQRIREGMKPGESLTLKQIREALFSNHVESQELRSALRLLEARGEVSVSETPTRGRPTIHVTRMSPTNHSNAPARKASKAPKAPAAALRRKTTAGND